MRVWDTETFQATRTVSGSEAFNNVVVVPRHYTEHHVLSTPVRVFSREAVPYLGREANGSGTPAVLAAAVAASAEEHSAADVAMRGLTWQMGGGERGAARVDGTAGVKGAKASQVELVGQEEEEDEEDEEDVQQEEKVQQQQGDSAAQEAPEPLEHRVVAEAKEDGTSGATAGAAADDDDDVAGSGMDAHDQILSAARKVGTCSLHFTHHLRCQRCVVLPNHPFRSCSHPCLHVCGFCLACLGCACPQALLQARAKRAAEPDAAVETKKEKKAKTATKKHKASNAASGSDASNRSTPHTSPSPGGKKKKKKKGRGTKNLKGKAKLKQSL